MILIEIPLPPKSETAHLLSVDMLLSSPKKVVSLVVKKKRHVGPTLRVFPSLSKIVTKSLENDGENQIFLQCGFVAT